MQSDSLFITCQQCQTRPATIKCQDCLMKYCYNCDAQKHKLANNHTTEIIPYNEMKSTKKSSKNQVMIESVYLPDIIQKKQEQKDQYKREIRELEQKLEENRKKMKEPNDSDQKIMEVRQKLEISKKEIEQLGVQEERQMKLVKQQVDKWDNLTNKLKKEYSVKLEEMKKIILLSEEKFGEMEKSRQQFKQEHPENQISKEDKEKLNKELVSQLKDQEELAKQTEQMLEQWIQKEQSQQNEIQKKEELIKNFKVLIEQMNEEKQLIASENQKIKQQLSQIKQLFKDKLPMLGIDPSLFDDDVEQDDQIEEEIEEQQPEDHSTEPEGGEDEQ